MRTLRVFDKKDYCDHFCRYERSAVRAVIVRGGQIALVKSHAEGFYKFPGGGVEPGETHLDALVRETREETGLLIDRVSVAALGMVREIKKGLGEDEIFDQKSYYYRAGILDRVSQTEMDDYEKALGFALEWVSLDEAYQVNRRLALRGGADFLYREAYVLRALRDGAF